MFIRSHAQMWSSISSSTTSEMEEELFRFASGTSLEENRKFDICSNVREKPEDLEDLEDLACEILSVHMSQNAIPVTDSGSSLSTFPLPPAMPMPKELEMRSPYFLAIRSIPSSLPQRIPLTIPIKLQSTGRPFIFTLSSGRSLSAFSKG